MWFDHLEESLSCNKVQLKKFSLPVKTSCPPTENINETPVRSVLLLAKEWRGKQTTKCLSMYSDLPGKSSSKSVSYSELASPSNMLWNEGEASVVTV